MALVPACPLCSATTHILSSRKAITHDNAMRRRRKCDTCDHTFSTLEMVEETVLAEAFIIEAYDDQGLAYPVTVVGDVARIGNELERLTGRRHHPATIHHWRLHRVVNGTEMEWRKEKVFPWP